MRFVLELTNPRAGWIDVAVAIGDDSFGFAASAVLADPIRELAELGLFIATGESGRAAVRFWLEPAGYELAVTRDDAYKLAWSYAHEARPQLLRPQLVHERVIDAPRAVASEILRCLRDVQPLLPLDGDQRVWRHPFPMEAVTRLAGLLAARP
jgi:hypothetical protein